MLLAKFSAILPAVLFASLLVMLPAICLQCCFAMLLVMLIAMLLVTWLQYCIHFYFQYCLECCLKCCLKCCFQWYLQCCSSQGWEGWIFLSFLRFIEWGLPFIGIGYQGYWRRIQFQELIESVFCSWEISVFVGFLITFRFDRFLYLCLRDFWN